VANDLTYTEALVKILERLTRVEARVNGELLGELRHMQAGIAAVGGSVDKISDRLDCVDALEKEQVRLCERVDNNKWLSRVNLATSLGLAGKLLYDWIMRTVT